MTSHFLSSSLSKALCDIGVVPSMDFWWTESNPEHKLQVIHSGEYLEDGWWFQPENLEENIPAIHIFDLIGKKENAIKVWGEWEKTYCSCCMRNHNTLSDCDTGVGNDISSWQYHTQKLLKLIQSNGDYETYIIETMKGI